ncbi:hypothetical protein [Mycobacterium marinum]|uniref:hypothetical protein n=1 Tax=Mycobacterium marinum TaxID=1781 RepID=UPI00115B01FE|nr:hypothetical protein [Mycobacterium marinum]
MNTAGRYGVWNGRDWQDYCLRLLRVRYANHQLQEVPDRDRGDLGLEAFTHDGVAFQCYAAEEPLDVKELYEKQRDKLTKDLNKLNRPDKRADLIALFNDVRIHTYVLMVPRHASKELVKHAQAKAQEVRGWKLPFIADNFNITIETDENYECERDQIWSIPPQLIDDRPIEGSEIEKWREQNEPLLVDAERKLGALGLAGKGLSVVQHTLLTQYLQGENMLTSLRRSFPDGWQAVARVKSTKEDLLALEYPPGEAESLADVKAIAEELATEICRAAPTVDQLSARVLAWSAVADWIFRCPLDFVEAS